MKTVLLITDSLGLPRDGVPSKYTWGRLLKEYFPQLDFVLRGDWGATTDKLREGSALEWFKPDVSIVQLGIVDCAPRLIGKHEAYVLRMFPSFVSNKYVKIVTKLRRRSEKRAYVNPDRFRDNIENYLGRARLQGAKIIFIMIGHVSGDMVRDNPGIKSTIDSYNKIIAEVSQGFDHVACVFPYEDGCEACVLADGYHFSEKGHSVCARNLEGKLKQLLLD